VLSVHNAIYLERCRLFTLSVWPWWRYGHFEVGGRKYLGGGGDKEGARASLPLEGSLSASRLNDTRQIADKESKSSTNR